MRKRSSKGGGAQRSIQVHLMVNEEEAAMIRAAARKRNQTVDASSLSCGFCLWLSLAWDCLVLIGFDGWWCFFPFVAVPGA